MTSQGHMTTGSLKQANKEDIRGIFYPPASQKSSAHRSFKIHTVNCGTLNSMM